jgi:hypothetical protein
LPSFQIVRTSAFSLEPERGNLNGAVFDSQVVLGIFPLKGVVDIGLANLSRNPEKEGPNLL